MAKIAGDDTKRVLPRKERRDDFPESSLRLAIYRTDEDRDDGYIQPTRTVNLES